jgi:hypothetical protein
MTAWMFYAGISAGTLAVFAVGYIAGGLAAPEPNRFRSHQRSGAGASADLYLYTEFTNQIEEAKTRLSLRNPAYLKLNQVLCELTLEDCDMDRLAAPARSKKQNDPADNK